MKRPPLKSHPMTSDTLPTLRLLEALIAPPLAHA